MFIQVLKETITDLLIDFWLVMNAPICPFGKARKEYEEAVINYRVERDMRKMQEIRERRVFKQRQKPDQS
jgi:hypothetical protein